jgi:hypothetical protein
VFNKNTKALVTISDDRSLFQHGNFLIKEFKLSDLGLENSEFNLARFRWEGDYETGKLIDLFKEKQAVVSEDEIDKKYYGIFFRKYPFEEVVFNVIKKIGSVDGFSVGEEFDKMRGFLISILNKKEKEKAFYKNSKNHIFETKEQEEQKTEQAFKV